MADDLRPRLSEADLDWRHPSHQLVTEERWGCDACPSLTRHLREMERQVAAGVAARVQRLTLGPGEALVVTYPDRITPAAVMRLRVEIRKVVPPEVPVLILDGGAELTVVEVAGGGAEADDHQA